MSLQSSLSEKFFDALDDVSQFINSLLLSLYSFSLSPSLSFSLSLSLSLSSYQLRERSSESEEEEEAMNTEEEESAEEESESELYTSLTHEVLSIINIPPSGCGYSILVPCIVLSWPVVLCFNLSL